MCSLLPYGTGICHNTFISQNPVVYFLKLFLLLFLSIPFFFSFLNFCLIWYRLTIPAWPNLTCSFNRGNSEGTNSRKISASIFCFMFYVAYGLVLWIDFGLEKRFVYWRSFASVRLTGR